MKLLPFCSRSDWRLQLLLNRTIPNATFTRRVSRDLQHFPDRSCGVLPANSAAPRSTTAGRSKPAPFGRKYDPMTADLAERLERCYSAAVHDVLRAMGHERV